MFSSWSNFLSIEFYRFPKIPILNKKWLIIPMCWGCITLICNSRGLKQWTEKDKRKDSMAWRNGKQICSTEGCREHKNWLFVESMMTDGACDGEISVLDISWEASGRRGPRGIVSAAHNTRLTLRAWIRFARRKASCKSLSGRTNIQTPLKIHPFIDSFINPLSILFSQQPLSMVLSRLHVIAIFWGVGVWRLSCGDLPLVFRSPAGKRMKGGYIYLPLVEFTLPSQRREGCAVHLLLVEFTLPAQWREGGAVHLLLVEFATPAGLWREGRAMYLLLVEFTLRRYPHSANNNL